MNAYKIFTNPQEIEVFKEIVPNDSDMRILEIDGKKLLLPIAFFYFMSYSIGCFLLFIAGSIGATLITAGVNLLQSNFRRLEMKMNKEINNIKNAMDEIKESIKK